jgi:hypothetical protein
MDECAAELAKRFEIMKPTKILTVATTGTCTQKKLLFFVRKSPW